MTQKSEDRCQHNRVGRAPDVSVVSGQCERVGHCQVALRHSRRNGLLRSPRASSPLLLVFLGQGGRFGLLTRPALLLTASDAVTTQEIIL